jgi:hypothetical protein
MQDQRDPLSNIRIRAEVEGIPPRVVNPMSMNSAMSAAEQKRQRKLEKARLTNAKQQGTVKHV